MKDTKSIRLAAALRDRTLVQFNRPRAYRDGSVSGYVMDVGPRWFLLALVDGDVRFNGFQCFLLSDVRELQVPHPRTAFFEAALTKRRERMPKKPRVSVESAEKLLVSAGGAFPLVTIHREKVDPDVCEIGHVVRVKDGRLTLLEISVDAVWDKDPKHYRLRDITRVDFGGEYEDALQLVGGRVGAR